VQLPGSSCNVVADPNFEGGQPLLWAVQFRNRAAMRLLLDAGAVKSERALQAAIAAGSAAVVAMLPGTQHQ
jgi:ankyrin repeat protein